VHAGRGGAGNISHVDPRNITAGADATGPASRTKITQSTPYYHVGRGGAGNLHYSRERPMFSFDEELERQRKMLEHQAPIYHVGRGGAGNYANEFTRRDSERSASSAVSTTSGHSVHDTWNRIRGSFSSKNQ